MAVTRPLLLSLVPAICLIPLLIGTDARGETLDGTPGRDIIRGTPERDVIHAYGGNDEIYSGSGDDFIQPGPGDDDPVDGGAGYDTVDYIYATGPVDVDLAAGMATGADGSDNLVRVEAVGGSKFDDILKGDATANVLKSGSGNDDIDGRGGDDVLGGGGGDDVFHPNLGNDRVEDFARGDDVLELHGLKDGSGRIIRAFADLDDNGDGLVTADDAVAEAAGGNLVLRFQEGSVTLVGVSLLDASDFRIVDAEPICRNPIYETRTDPLCGPKRFGRGRGPVCGIELFNERTGEVCGVASYNIGQSDVCGVDQYKLAQSPLCGHESDGRVLLAGEPVDLLYVADHHATSCRERGGRPEWLMDGMVSYSSRPSEDDIRISNFRYFYLNCFELKTCRDPSFGVESYKSCEHPSFGPRSFHSCRHESFGVELYVECEHPDFGVAEYNTCQKPEFGIIGCAD